METKDLSLTELRRAVLEDLRNGEKRYLLGAELAQQRDYEGAVLEMSAAIALNPFLHIARLQLGLLHLTMAQPQHTAAVLAPLEELDNRSPLKHFKHGIEALIADDFANCIRSLEQGIELNRENAPLNRDMRLIVERVRQATPASADTQGADAVRTDFELYGLTKH